MFKVNIKDTKTNHWRRLRIFIYNFEHTVNFEHLVLLFLLFTLSIWKAFEKRFKKLRY